MRDPGRPPEGALTPEAWKAPVRRLNTPFAINMSRPNVAHFLSSLIITF